jgi:Flp pilus assembly protein TadD
LKLDGNDLVSLNDLAWLLGERASLDEALSLASKAQGLAPQSASIMDTLAWIHYRRQSYGEAEKLLVRAAERAPANGLIRFHLGMVYAKLGRKIDAASELRRAAALDPKLADREKINRGAR